MKKLGLAFLIMAMTGCVTTEYSWGPYEQGLYDYYKKPESGNEFLAELEVHVASIREGGAKPAPGLLAEIGTLYLERNDTQSAIKYYEYERDTWPESRPLMDSLIKNLSDNASKG